jgi:NADH-quinone oxidoreductase subunit H
MSAFTAILFLGGWLPIYDNEFFNAIPSPVWLCIKIFLILFCFIWVRATLPRYRYDQLMRLGWKVFLPLSLTWVVGTAAYVVYLK